HRTGDNPARWRDHLSNLLPAKAKIKPTLHQKALPYAEMPAFLAELRQRKAIAARALEFLALTCVRTSDIRAAKWEQVDFREKVWTIPQFSKTHKEHRVPLSDNAVSVLEEVRRISSAIGGSVAASEFIFPNDITGAPLSSNALLALIERMDRKGQMTGHGCRSTFRDWALEQTNFPWELAEMSLGHTVGTKVERAYARGDAREKRREIMQAWADYCSMSKPKGDNIVSMSRPSAP
ncbi:MAG TPA: site-specific integrase, partial [Sphingomicrobium sp.]|nr:site-specific integrase [Sphingomicrobium sp.]